MDDERIVFMESIFIGILVLFALKTVSGLDTANDAKLAMAHKVLRNKRYRELVLLKAQVGKKSKGLALQKGSQGAKDAAGAMKTMMNSDDDK